MKNGNGNGSVYKANGKRRKPWIVRVTIGYSTTGKQVRKIIGSYETKREGQEVLLEYLKNPNLFSKITFGEVRKLWWDNYTKKVSTKTTIQTHIYRMRAFDSLENIPIVDLKLFQLQELFDNMTTSSSFKRGCKSILNMIFDFALKNDFIKSNKVQFIEIGKKEKVLERKIFTKEEIEVLWKNIKMPYVYIILILIYTGMRIGELINLKNEDINLKENILQVKVSKTSNGIRMIPISSKIILLFSENMKNDQIYFVKGDTTEQLSYSTFKPRFNKLLQKLGIEKHTIHDTRHTFATLMNNANVNSTSIVKLIGHSNFLTTENIYTHKDKEELRKAIESI
ncbi:site-specific integrase [Fusobacterium sp.]|jgi:site-specific recombinase, phage integrase family|uniref:tyrosine-type recombinase/integrase n=1 Tax=Fusobacterium sp. TaxID=68766 RepID=UPI002A81BEFD|nr:site-specific integrase [Fusobacterium sp.]